MNRAPEKPKFPSQWLTPFDPNVLGGLRPLINQYADGGSTILTPKKYPTTTVSNSSSITQQDVPTPPPTPVFSGLLAVFKSSDGSTQIINQGSTATITINIGTPPPTVPNVYLALAIVTLNCNKGLFAYEWFIDDVSSGNTNPYMTVSISGSAPVYGTAKYDCIITFPDASTAHFQVLVETAV